MLVNIFPPKKSLKNLIMNILLISQEITVEDLRKQIKTKYGI